MYLSCHKLQSILKPYLSSCIHSRKLMSWIQLIKFYVREKDRGESVR